MVWTDLTRKAYSIAERAHMGQVDKCGVDYIQHPLFVASQLVDECEVCAALLHDVVEDTVFSLSDLSVVGFPSRVVQLVDLLTRPSGLTYTQYIRRLSVDPGAVRIKLADLEHNLDPSRALYISDSLRVRYIRAQRFLLNLI